MSPQSLPIFPWSTFASIVTCHRSHFFFFSTSSKPATYPLARVTIRSNATAWSSVSVRDVTSTPEPFSTAFRNASSSASDSDIPVPVTRTVTMSAARTGDANTRAAARNRNIQTTGLMASS